MYTEALYTSHVCILVGWKTGLSWGARMAGLLSLHRLRASSVPPGTSSRVIRLISWQLWAPEMKKQKLPIFPKAETWNWHSITSATFYGFDEREDYKKVWYIGGYF